MNVGINAGLDPIWWTPKIGRRVQEVSHGKRPRRSFSDQFKAETVALIRSSGKSVAEVSRELDLTATAVRRWVGRAEIDAGRRDGLTTIERVELTTLRRENRGLREEREILKKAAAFFAKETTR